MSADSSDGSAAPAARLLALLPAACTSLCAPSPARSFSIAAGGNFALHQIVSGSPMPQQILVLSPMQKYHSHHACDARDDRRVLPGGDRAPLFNGAPCGGGGGGGRH